MKTKGFKKLGSVILASALCLTAFAGCGSGSEPAEVKAMKERYSQYVTLPQYKGVEYTASHTEVTDEDVQSEIDYLVSMATTETEVTEGTVALGDTVNIDYVGSIDGVEFAGGSTGGNGTAITLGSSGYIDNFDEQIVGHSVGDTFNVEVTFPDEYAPNPDLAGCPAVFVTTINSKTVKNVPEYNDELVAAKTEFVSTAEYEANVRSDLASQYAADDELADKQAVFTKIMDTTTITEYPEQELKDQVDSTISQISEQAAQNGIDFTTYIMYFYGFQSEDDFYAEVMETVKSYMQEKMIMVAIADAEGITVTKEEKEAKVQELLANYGLTDVAELNQYFTEEDYYYGVLSDKVINFLMENATPVAE